MGLRPSSISSGLLIALPSSSNQYRDEERGSQGVDFAANLELAGTSEDAPVLGPSLFQACSRRRSKPDAPCGSRDERFHRSPADVELHGVSLSECSGCFLAAFLRNGVDRAAQRRKPSSPAAGGLWTTPEDRSRLYQFSRRSQVLVFSAAGARCVPEKTRVTITTMSTTPTAATT